MPKHTIMVVDDEKNICELMRLYLEKEGYVERKVSETDKRETLVYPTQKMLDILPEVTDITKTWNEMVAQDISREELELFHRILDKMLDKSMEIVYSGDAQ